MAMSHPLAEDLDKLNQIADEVRVSADADGYLVEQATSLHHAFALNRRPKSALTRNLVIDALERGASQAGVHCEPVAGGARQLRFVTDTGFRIFRLLSARKTASGSYRIPTNNASAWASLDEETLLIDEHWVLFYTLNDDGSVEDMFASRVLEVIEGKPGRLVLSPATRLGTGMSPWPNGFQPSDENLDAFFDDADEADEDPDSASESA